MDSRTLTRCVCFGLTFILCASGLLLALSGHSVAVSAPSAPTNVLATPSYHSVFLEWDPPADDGGAVIDSYVIVRSPFFDGPYEFVSSTYETTYTDNSVSNGAEYWYQIQAVNAGGHGTMSHPISVTPGSIPLVISLTLHDSGKGYSVPVQSGWTVEDDVNGPGGLTVQVLITGPLWDGIQTYVAVDSGYDMSIVDTRAFMYQIVNDTLKDFEESRLDVYLAGEPLLTKITNRTAIIFEVITATPYNLRERCVVIIDADAKYYWQFGFTASGESWSYLDPMYTATLQGFVVTSSPATTQQIEFTIIIATAIVCTVLFVIILEFWALRHKCATCGRWVNRRFAICPKCGGHTNGLVTFCERCGEKILPGITTCSNCGHEGESKKPPNA